MSSHILDGRDVLINRLQKLLGTLVHSVEIASQNNLSSSHVVAEATTAGLLNRIYGWELVNANAIRQNFPGVDLIDERKNIAVQVTSPIPRSPSPKSDPKSGQAQRLSAFPSHRKLDFHIFHPLPQISNHNCRPPGPSCHGPVQDAYAPTMVATSARPRWS